MKPFRRATFPPDEPWDARLAAPACTDLVPVRALHENPWFAVRDRGGYFTLEYHLPQVVVLPVIDDDALLMVRVKRPVLDDVTLEFPAGAIEHGESPVEAAMRELAEESGVRVTDPGRFRPMPPLAVSATRMPTLSYVYRVDLSQAEFDARAPHDDEVQAVERIPAGEIAGLIASGAIYVSVPLALMGRFLAARGDGAAGR